LPTAGFGLTSTLSFVPGFGTQADAKVAVVVLIYTSVKVAAAVSMIYLILYEKAPDEPIAKLLMNS